MPDDAPSPHEPAWLMPTVGVAGELVGAGVGLVVAGPVGAVLAAVAGPAAEKFTALVIDRARRRGQTVVAAAEIESGIGQEDLLARIADDQDLYNLFVRVDLASGATALELKLRALGRALGRAAVDGDRIDESICLVAALNDMDGPHIRLLKLLTNAPPQTPAASRATVGISTGSRKNPVWSLLENPSWQS